LFQFPFVASLDENRSAAKRRSGREFSPRRRRACEKTSTIALNLKARRRENRYAAAPKESLTMLNLNPKTAALVLIDLQKGILARPLAPHGAAEVVDKAARLGVSLKRAGGVVAPVHVAYSADGADRLRQPVDATLSATGAVPPDWADFVPEIAALPADFVIVKRQWGAFHGTELDLQLRRRGIDAIILGGVATNYGVEQTAREAWQLGYAVIVAEDASSSMGEDLHKFSIEKILPRISRIRSTAEILVAIEA
jgi:nicotinamidase-related amidase